MTRTQFGRFLTRGTLLGATIGAVLGVAIGLFTYAPTSPFALVEGAVLGGAAGLFGSLLLYPLLLRAGRLGLHSRLAADPPARLRSLPTDGPIH